MRSDITLSTLPEINRVWNLFDRYWPTRDLDVASTAFPVDIYEQDGKVFVRASVPGVSAQDLNVTLEHRVLTISGETCEHFEDRPGSRRYLREHAYGKFVRSVRLPDDVDENQCEAQFENGVITVSCPLTRPKQIEPKQIPVRDTTSNKSITGKPYVDRPTESATKVGGGQKGSNK